MALDIQAGDIPPPMIEESTMAAIAKSVTSSSAAQSASTASATALMVGAAISHVMQRSLVSDAVSPTRARQVESEVVAVNAALVRKIARQLAAKLPASVEIDDLVQAGTIGLLEAFRKYNSSHGASFETYAAIRIHGAMLDEMRQGDWTPRSVHRGLRDAGKARREIEQRCGRAAGAAEVASSMALSTNDYHRLLDDAGRSRMMSLESQIEAHGSDWLAAADATTPEMLLNRAGFRQELASAISALPQREQFAVTSYFQHGLSLRDIGTALGIGESRACQIIGHATRMLKSRLADWDRSDAED